MKQITAAALGMMLTALFAGCVSLTAPGIVVSPPSLHGEKWTISGTEKTNTGKTNSYATILTIQVNGNPVIQGPLSWSSATSLHGTYEGHDIQAICPYVGKRTQPYCQVYVDGTQAATLFFG